jgi:hypothetical protein
MPGSADGLAYVQRISDEYAELNIRFSIKVVSCPDFLLWKTRAFDLERAWEWYLG